MGSHSVARGPVRAAERALAPDLARGVMLLLICLSNTGFHLYAAHHGASGWHPDEGSTADRVTQFVMITCLDLRVYPLFAFLFGYGMTQLYLRQTARGATPRDAVRLLRRRGLWLIVFGFAHAAFLMAGDITGAYGVASLLLGWLFVRRGDRTVLVGAAVALALVLLSAWPAVTAVAAGDLGRLGDAPTEPTTVVYAAGEDDPLAAAGTRLTTWAFVTLAGGFLAAPMFLVMLLGFWAARRRVLEEPARHLRLLRWTAVVGITVGWLGGLPAALAHVGALRVPADAVSEAGALRLISEATGPFAGLGYVAVFALLAGRPRRPGRATRAVAALGSRSLSGYLAHSLLFAPLLAAWGLGLGAHLSSATMALLACAVWLTTVLAAALQERHAPDHPGPAESLLRRRTYGHRAAP
ncbi:DUF418 domain-containing protein [Streptomyces millisiae]|uniref:DUF418 domain-containing protein n=1 Tax=Streptomyces millisiae TaxID=3075542 RepID=A0ABU2LYR7_9ACTN|nr:DUF418 domain-containing protein [Streptomyces sp. DSM 44918]MDT0322153.1 DUF418 domain-containing protein [Streptomyces sp. DSM 44918]